jgi:hypothetical protein
LAQPKVCDAMSRAGARVVEEMGGALDRTWAALDPYIHPLRVEAALRGEAPEGERAQSVNGGFRGRRSPLGWK